VSLVEDEMREFDELETAQRGDHALEGSLLQESPGFRLSSGPLRSG
jgi:hypothetical protein